MSSLNDGGVCDDVVGVRVVVGLGLMVIGFVEVTGSNVVVSSVLLDVVVEIIADLQDAILLGINIADG